MEMVRKNNTSFDEFETELLKKPGVRKAYTDLQPKYDIIRALIKRRIELGISQQNLAIMIGTKQPAISRLESGDRDSTIGTLTRVAGALGLEVRLSPSRKSKPHRSIKSAELTRP
jgi:ribosome-binding protein aMBF1 (putative translation factor)